MPLLRGPLGQFGGGSCFSASIGAIMFICCILDGYHKNKLQKKNYISGCHGNQDRIFFQKNVYRFSPHRKSFLCAVKIGYFHNSGLYSGYDCRGKAM